MNRETSRGGAHAPVKVGVLGAARIAPAALISPAHERPDVEVVALAARDPARARAFADALSVPHVASDYAELIAREDVELVYVALHAGAHAEWSIRALEAGKAVLCEKPFALNAAQATEMVEASRASDRPLLEAFHYRFHSILKSAFQIVSEGGLGRLASAEATFNAPIPFRPDEIRWRRELGGGALMDLGCYCLHALRTLCGEPHVIAAHCQVERGVDAETTAVLGFESGLQASLACAMNVERPTARLILEGERGRLEIVNFVAPQLGCRFTLDLGKGPVTQPTDGPTSYAAQLDHVIAVLRGGAAPITGGEDAIANMMAIEAIYAHAGVC
ncbi:MAG: Gfo/Idh/MocA family protein [Caulobacteraceae bacterium]